MINLENKEDNKHLKEIVSLLIAKFNIEYIFINTYVSIDMPFYELLILLSNKEIKTIGELDPQIKVALGGYHKFHHFSYASLQVRDKLRAGNLFLFSSCHPQKLVYKKADSGFEIYPRDFSPSTSLDAVHALFKREQHKIKEFKEGFHFYKERGNCEHAAFMLHQVIELSYRAVEILTIGKDRVTHSIRTHQRYLSRYAPFMSQIFKEDKEEDRAMLKRLDLIYKSTRYEDCFDVKMDELLKLESKMSQVLSASKVIYKNMVNDFEKEFMVPNNENQESVNKKTVDFKDIEPIDTLINQITEHFDVEAICLFGARNHTYERKSLFESEDKKHTSRYHFYLLLACDNETKEQVYSLESSINQSTEYSVLFLPHAKDEIQKGLAGNSKPFHEILQKGECVYIKQGGGMIVVFLVSSLSFLRLGLAT